MNRSQYIFSNGAHKNSRGEISKKINKMGDVKRNIANKKSFSEEKLFPKMGALHMASVSTLHYPISTDNDN
ncbi:hypothetical protein JCM2421_07490 [Staphylococcus auricularis]|nr:hypothetical protein JCM2421_07490 [Staphylococcus auricularis]